MHGTARMAPPEIASRLRHDRDQHNWGRVSACSVAVEGQCMQCGGAVSRAAALVRDCSAGLAGAPSWHLRSYAPCPHDTRVAAGGLVAVVGPAESALRAHAAHRTPVITQRGATLLALRRSASGRFFVDNILGPPPSGVPVSYSSSIVFRFESQSFGYPVTPTTWWAGRVFTPFRPPWPDRVFSNE